MLEDLSLMRSIPNMTVLCPSDDVQTKWAIKEMAKFDGPVYIRLARVATPVIYDENQTFEIGKDGSNWKWNRCNCVCNRG